MRIHSSKPKKVGKCEGMEMKGVPRDKYVPDKRVTNAG